MKKIIFWIFTLFLLFPCACSALERFEIITTNEMQELLADRERGTIDFILVNALDKMIFRHSSIPGSVNIPLNKLTEYSKLLGTNLNKLIIPY
jgi:hypothetical protein